jgi:hypothetical protein
MVLANTLALARSEHNACSGLTTKNDPLGRIIFRPLAENEIHPDSSIVAVVGGPSKLKATMEQTPKRPSSRRSGPAAAPPSRLPHHLLVCTRLADRFRAAVSASPPH